MKADWMEGYNAEEAYTAKYFRFLNPGYLNMCAITSGLRAIPTEESFTYCELGCGYGLSILMNAASYPQGTFYAIDYNPTQIAYAQSLAKDAGLTNIHFLELSFQDLVDNPSILPQFDFIVFHGIFSWVNDINRDNLVKICNHHLKSGGMVYNSYNVKPGWSITESLQQLMINLANELPGSTRSKMDTVLSEVNSLIDLKEGFFNEQQKTLKNYLKTIQSKDRTYLIQEYMNDDWRAFYFPEVYKKMLSAKLEYLGQALTVDKLSKQLQSKKLQSAIEKADLIENRELIKDLAYNTKFRKDLYIRGNYGEINRFEIQEWFLNQRWIRLTPLAKIEKYTFVFSQGKFDVANRDLYRCIMDSLAKEVMSGKDLLNKCKCKAGMLTEALTLLSHNNYIDIYKELPKESNRINRAIVSRVFDSVDIEYILYPRALRAYKTNRVHQLFLDAIEQGYSKSSDLVEYVYNKFTHYQQSLTINGKALVGKELKEQLQVIEKAWREKILPIWKMAGVV